MIGTRTPIEMRWQNSIQNEDMNLIQIDASLTKFGLPQFMKNTMKHDCVKKNGPVGSEKNEEKLQNLEGFGRSD